MLSPRLAENIFMAGCCVYLRGVLLYLPDHIARLLDSPPSSVYPTQIAIRKSPWSISLFIYPASNISRECLVR